MIKELQHRIDSAMKIISENGMIDGSHHKQWCLDQIARILLTEKNYLSWVHEMRGEYIPEDQCYTYDDWDEGIAP